MEEGTARVKFQGDRNLTHLRKRVEIMSGDSVSKPRLGQKELGDIQAMESH